MCQPAAEEEMRLPENGSARLPQIEAQVDRLVSILEVLERADSFRLIDACIAAMNNVVLSFDSECERDAKEGIMTPDKDFDIADAIYGLEAKRK